MYFYFFYRKNEKSLCGSVNYEGLREREHSGDVLLNKVLKNN